MPAADSPALPEAITFTRRSPTGAAHAVVAVGNFDGVHLGHAAIIARLRAMAVRRSAESVAVTFDPHPATLVRPGGAPSPLTTIARRAELLLDLGVDRVLVQPVVPALVALSAEAFFEHVLRERLAAVGIVEGVDFRFGRGRQGDVAMLGRLCAASGLELDVVEPVELAGGIVSSSRVRSLIAAGDVGLAATFLTAAYRASGEVVEGARRGRGLGFPTANLAGITTLLPAPGVYAAAAVIDGATAATATEPACYPAAVHVGANVTFGETALSVEAHLVGYTGDLYGTTLHVDFLQRLRETCRFPSRETLVGQLTADVQQARQVFTDSRGSAAADASTARDGISARPYHSDRHPHAS